MALYQDWKSKYEQKSGEASDEYFAQYLEKETEAYKIILAEKQAILTGTVAELAQKFSLTESETVGFLDGINDSLENPMSDEAIEAIETDTQIDSKIDFKKLFVNMLAVPADWLYNLKEWDGIIEPAEREEIIREYKLSKMAVSNKVGRNEPCPCGSGKKYKNCCGKE
ncbi:MAG: SEC-C metal-binding domain-containing protein [Bacillota bacterium]